MKIFSLLVAIVLAHSLHAHNNYNMRSPVVEDETTLEQHAHAYREIQTEELSNIVRSANPSVKIVDARGTQYDDGKRIPGAKIIPVNATIKNISANLPDKNEMIIVYCSNLKCPASGMLADRLLNLGYKNVWKYAGGIEEWEAKGQKIEKGKPAAEAANEWGPKSA